METVRLRLVFDQVLSKSQKSESLKRSWILLKPQHRTISDLSSYILNAFDLQNECPRGLLLSMEGFALPPFESTAILKDKDIISVEKNGGGSSEIVMVGHETNNSLEVVEIVDTQPVVAGMNLLANEEFEKESGGYQSEEEEEEEDTPKKMEDEVHVENTPPEVKKVSKKRKASKELKSCTKKKKQKSASAEKGIIVEAGGNNVKSASVEKGVIVEAGGNNVSGERNGTLSTAKVNERIERSKTSCSAKRNSQHRENGNWSVDASLTPNGTKKLCSRSARRKKAMRRRKKEKLKAERKELRLRQLRGKSDEESSSEEDSLGVSQESAEKGNRVSELVPERDSEKPLEGHQQPDQDSDVEDDVVPVVIRPGHIRFEPLRKVGAHQTPQQNQIPLNTFHWNGITSKRKGQKWGKEKVTSYKRNDYRNVNQEHSKILNIEARPRPVYDCINFEKLEFYTSLPKEGDVIAYRLLELSSSLTPELSSYAVGKISRYDIEGNKVRLVPVPGYPVIPEKEMGDNGLSETYPLGRDGSTWMEFSKLCEIRLVTGGNLNSVNPVAGGVNNIDRDDGTSFRPNNANEAHASAQENGEIDAWEQINQALESKKVQLSQKDNWNKAQSSSQEDSWNKAPSSSQVDNWNKTQSSSHINNWNRTHSSSQADNWNRTQSSGRRPWSYKALRGSALGPTVAMLRAQNEL